jgi:hypothetical protein
MARGEALCESVVTSRSPAIGVGPGNLGGPVEYRRVLQPGGLGEHLKSKVERAEHVTWIVSVQVRGTVPVLFWDCAFGKRGKG